MTQQQLATLPYEAKPQPINCEVCNKPLLTDDDNCHFAEIRRGYFEEQSDGEIEVERIKASFYICLDCYFNDSDLCKFFNKIGWRIR